MSGPFLISSAPSTEYPTSTRPYHPSVACAVPAAPVKSAASASEVFHLFCMIVPLEGCALEPAHSDRCPDTLMGRYSTGETIASDAGPLVSRTRPGAGVPAPAASAESLMA